MATRPKKAHMQRAIELALEGVRTDRGGPFGALVVQAGVIVGEGSNSVTSSNDPTAHAEIVAIRAACQKLGTFSLAGATLYASCEPCPMCLAAIHWARIEQVFFACDRHDAARAGFDDAALYEEFERPPPVRKLALTAWMRDEGLEAFRAWLAKADRKPY
jgi:guanine deaminase